MVLRGPHHSGHEGRDRAVARRPLGSRISSSVEPLARWLRCPHCGSALAASERLVLACANGHRFDVNKRGYLTAVDRSSGIHGDGRAILEARAAFLATGAYSPVADLVDAVVPRHPGVRILDSGCGTGYYLARLLATRRDCAALALDVSADAVIATIAATAGERGVRRAFGLVADVWRPLPVRDAAADVILCVFAPRNPFEFARVLDDRGRLVVVTPQPDHLRQLRAVGAVLGIQDDKLGALDASLSSAFTLHSRDALNYEIEVDHREAALLAGMGPAGHHDRGGAYYSGAVTVAVEISVYAKSG